jgi:hypothetical protein
MRLSETLYDAKERSIPFSLHYIYIYIPTSVFERLLHACPPSTSAPPPPDFCGKVRVRGDNSSRGKCGWIGVGDWGRMANPRYPLRIGDDPDRVYTVHFSILSEHTRSYTHLDIHVRLHTAACTDHRAMDNPACVEVSQFPHLSMSSYLTNTTIDGDGRRPQPPAVSGSPGHLQTTANPNKNTTNTTREQDRDEDENTEQRPSLAGPSRSRSQSQSHTAPSGEGKVRKKRALISCAGESPCWTCQVARLETSICQSICRRVRTYDVACRTQDIRPDECSMVAALCGCRRYFLGSISNSDDRLGCPFVCMFLIIIFFSQSLTRSALAFSYPSLFPVMTKIECRRLKLRCDRKGEWVL